MKKTYFLTLILVLIPIIYTACSSFIVVNTPISPDTAPLNTVKISTSTVLTNVNLVPAITATRTIDDFYLRKLTKEEYYFSIFEDQNLLSDTLHFPNLSSFSQSELRKYLITIKKEAITRFPKSEKRNKIYWDLVYEEVTKVSTTSFDKKPVEPFITLLTEALNSGQVEPNNLKAWLLQYNFEIVTNYKTQNLFGDELIADVLHIKTVSYPVKSSIIVLKKNHQGVYKSISLRQHWREYSPLSNQTEERISIGDYNGNGQQDILSIFDTANLQICSTDIALYEWIDHPQEEGFVNIASHIEEVVKTYTSYEDECLNVWQVSPDASTNGQSIIKTDYLYNWGGIDCSVYQSYIRYDWVGNHYRWSGREVEPLNSSLQTGCAVGWANRAIDDGLYELAVPLLDTALKNWPDELKEIWGQNGKDYFSFKLGIGYALQGRTDLTQSLLRRVQNQPSNPKFVLMSEIAEAYLSNYKKTKDIYMACIAANEVATTKIVSLSKQFDTSNLIIEHLKQVLGIADPHWFFGPNRVELCNIQAVFERSFHLFNPNTEKELMNWLQKKNIPVWAIELMDVTGNKLKDWIVIMKSINQKANLWEIWVLLNQDEDRLVLVKIPSGQAPLYNLEKSIITMESFHPNQAFPQINLLYLSNKLNAFYIVQQDSMIHAESIFGKENVSHYSIDKNNINTELNIFYETESENYIWDSIVQDFVVQQPILSTFEQQILYIKQIENILFQQGDYAKAIELLQDLLTDSNTLLKNNIMPDYIFYLLGLSYELSRNYEKTIETYLKLRQTYPKSPYVLMIQRKLINVESKSE